MSLAGRKFIYSYENGLEFHTQFPGAESVKWECIAGSEKGKTGEGPVRIIALGGDRHFLNWVEADGLVVTQVTELGEGAVITSLVFPQGFDGKSKVESLVIRGTVVEAGG